MRDTTEKHHRGPSGNVLASLATHNYVTWACAEVLVRARSGSFRGANRHGMGEAIGPGSRIASLKSLEEQVQGSPWGQPRLRAVGDVGSLFFSSTANQRPARGQPEQILSKLPCPILPGIRNKDGRIRSVLATTTVTALVVISFRMTPTWDDSRLSRGEPG